MTEPANPGAFDAYAASYEAALDQGLAVSGETREFFARGRLAWLAGCLRLRGEPAPGSVLDFGCGTGSTTPFLFAELRAKAVVGLEVSERSLDVARSRFGQSGARFVLLRDYRPAEEFDLVYCNGVFHHIEPEQRGEALQLVWRSLRPGGCFTLWENNPWNLGTRYVMHRIPFDRDAIPISPPAARRLLREGGFDVLQTDFLFIFPKVLRWLRGIERSLSHWPLGAQYQVLCRKPLR
jgi:SAM-dependent methyltransferase